jgi:hypothetical protein
MDEPQFILEPYTRVRTHDPLGSTAGFMVGPKAMGARTPGVIGIINGIVPGHGGDVYFVSHIGGTSPAAYGWMEFELEPVVEPKCEDCKGGGFDFPASQKAAMGTACEWCKGTGSAPPHPRPTAWERLKEEP